jgi:DNA-binding MarR family transcriptional regulator
VLLEITPAGLAIINEVAPESRLIYDKLEKRFGRERIDQLLDMLDELAALNDND